MLEGEEDEGVVDLLVFDENGGLILEPCGECVQGVIGAHCGPGCDSYMRPLCGDTIGEK